MIIVIADGTTRLDEPSDFHALKVLLDPELPKAMADAALGALGRRDGAHVWVNRLWFEHAGPQNAEWRAGLIGMLDYAAKKGWTNEAGQVRVHIERAGGAEPAGASPMPSTPSPAAGLDRRALALIGYCAVVYVLDGMIPALLGPLAPAVSRQIGLSHAELGSIFSSDLIGQSIGLFVVPLLGRWVKLRDMLWLSLVGLSIAHALSGLAQSRDMLFALRLLTGFFVGGALPAGLALVAAGVPAARRGTALMLLFTGYGVGKASAGLLAGLFGVDAWRILLFATGALTFVVALIVWRRLEAPELVGRPAGSPHRKEDAAPVKAMFAGKAAVGTLLIWVMFVASLTINFCLATWLPTLLVESGRGPDMASFAYSLFAFGGIVATFAYGPLIDRFGIYASIGTSYAVGAVLLGVIGFNFQHLADPALLLLLAITGFFILGSYGGINVVLADFYPAPLRAVGAGWAKGVGRLGTIIAPIMIGVALSAGVTGSYIMSLFAFPALVCLCALLVIRRLRRHEPLAA